MRIGISGISLAAPSGDLRR